MASETETTEREANPDTNPGKLRVLVVDNNLDRAASLATLLHTDGHEVQVALHGPSACYAAKKAQPDVVLLDMGLLGVAGYAVARQMRAEANRKPLFLIALEAVDAPACPPLGEAGVDLHLVGPVDPTRLRRLLQRIHSIFY